MIESKDPPAVLVVEDEAFTRMDAADTISNIGIPNFEAGDAGEALGMLENNPTIAVLFTDVNMPGPMDGITLARRVHDMRPDVGIIVTSGARKIAESDLPDDGIFLPKPYRPQQLVDAIKRKLPHSH